MTTKFERAVQSARRAHRAEWLTTMAICLVPVVAGILATLQAIGVVS